MIFRWEQPVEKGDLQVAWFGFELFIVEMLRIVVNDMSFMFLAFVFVFVYMWLHIKSVFVAALSCFQIFMSIPVSVFIFKYFEFVFGKVFFEISFLVGQIGFRFAVHNRITRNH